jgi:hypothetical protein
MRGGTGIAYALNCQKLHTILTIRMLNKGECLALIEIQGPSRRRQTCCAQVTMGLMEL